jgi:hypothetical protein
VRHAEPAISHAVFLKRESKGRAKEWHHKEHLSAAHKHQHRHTSIIHPVAIFLQQQQHLLVTFSHNSPLSAHVEEISLLYFTYF